MTISRGVEIFDSLYGAIDVTGPLADLLCTPAVQRLRDIRLSNIDSITMPGISNISRFEHAVGTAYLGRRAGFRVRLDAANAIAIEAAALLHDVAIAAFGHLVEEALQYLSVGFNHETKLSILLQNFGGQELGGVNLQIYSNRESGIQTWADRTFGAEAPRLLGTIAEALNGRGRFGKCIKGDVDLDNLDNLTRIAFHMGLDVDRKLPLEIATRMIRCTEEDGLIFSNDCTGLLEKWLKLRRDVYERLMLSRPDFAGKIMLIYSVVNAYKRNKLGPGIYAWTLTDRQLIQHLLSVEEDAVAETVRRWLVRELWPLSDLFWMRGELPDYASVHSFSEIASESIGRPCFAYRILDKRVRTIRVKVESKDAVEIGRSPDKWVLGVASPRRENFSNDENRRLQALASGYFNAAYAGEAEGAGGEALPLFK